MVREQTVKDLQLEPSLIIQLQMLLRLKLVQRQWVAKVAV